MSLVSGASAVPLCRAALKHTHSTGKQGFEAPVVGQVADDLVPRTTAGAQGGCSSKNKRIFACPILPMHPSCLSPQPAHHNHSMLRKQIIWQAISAGGGDRSLTYILVSLPSLA